MKYLWIAEVCDLDENGYSCTSVYNTIVVSETKEGAEEKLRAERKDIVYFLGRIKLENLEDIGRE